VLVELGDVLSVQFNAMAFRDVTMNLLGS